MDQENSMNTLNNLNFDEDLYVNTELNKEFKFEIDSDAEPELKTTGAKNEFLMKRNSIDCPKDFKEISINKKFVKSNVDDNSKILLDENLTEICLKDVQNTVDIQISNSNQSKCGVKNPSNGTATFLAAKEDFLTEAKTFLDNLEINHSNTMSQEIKHHNNFLVQNKENFDEPSCDSFSESEYTQSNFEWLNIVTNNTPGIIKEEKIPQNNNTSNFDVTPEERFEEFKSVVHLLLKNSTPDKIDTVKTP